MLYKHSLQTGNHDQMLEISRQIKESLRQAQVQDGLAIVYSPHTTAGITINENADPDVVHDLLMRLEEIYTRKHPRDRHGEGNSAAHLKASLMGPSQSIPIANGKLILGVWQGIYFCEFDGPRSRSFYVKIIKN
jgi:secondary thiamine-phosphate synthase enzyme